MLLGHVIRNRQADNREGQEGENHDDNENVGKQKGFMRTKAVHVRYKSLYISLPFSAKQREVIQFYLV